MSSQNEDGSSMDSFSEKSDYVSVKPKISYSREFLLSLSNLDICKKLPRGFNESLTSDFEDGLLGGPDRPRIPGTFASQGFRRNEYSSSPPTRGGIYGKWESRSSGRSDRDSDSQSDRDSDSGRRYGYQSRRSWQTPEHDGLLGSGSFPRPSGFAAGTSASKARTNEHNQLSRSSEPYQPPRPYKAVPHLRRDTDSYNDETFGSVECTSEDRAEEEKRRRAAFETMRKEQQKALREKQKLNLEKHKAGGLSDLCEVLGNNKEEKEFVGNNQLEVSAPIPILSSDLEKSSFTSHSPASRPLIPPGFKNNTLEKNSSLKSQIHPTLPEVGKPVTGENLVDVRHTNDGLEGQLSQEISVVDGKPAEKNQHALLLNKGENLNVHMSLDVPAKKPGMEDKLLHASNRLGSHGTLDVPEIAEVHAKALDEKTVHDSNRSSSTSILEKIFGSTLSVAEGQSSLPEHHDSKPDDAWSPKSVRSSKFAQWFLEEEAKADDISSARADDLLTINAKADDDLSSERPNDLLSLIVSGDKASGSADQVCINNKEDTAPTVLTCEDLEQSILSEYSTKTTSVQPVLESWGATSSNTKQPTQHVDDHASLHLLSMLQKSTDQSSISVSSSVDMNSADKHDTATLVNEPKGAENGTVLPNLGKTLTLEALFGTAFMKELQSVEAPVSVQRGSVGSARVDAPEAFPVTDNGISSPKIDKNELQKDYSVSLNHRQHTKPSEADNWLGFDDPPIEIASSKLHMEAGRRHGGVVFQLPGEDNLISGGDTQDHRMSAFMPTGNSISNFNLSSNTPINIAEKLGALRGVKEEPGMEGSHGLPFAPDSYEQMASQMSQVRPLYPHQESHPARMSPQQKFMGPEPMYNHDPPANHQLPPNMIRPPFHHPNVRVAGFDIPSQQAMLHQMQIPRNHPQHFPRGGSVPHHGNQAAGFMELNQMQGFPFGAPNQPNMGSRGVPVRGNTSEAFQRLIEMELRAKSKQIHPLAAGHTQGAEVDMGFRYR